jgi:enoyl-[acyl-carrier protein] reductase/trans-2-enoyl-CoA reductase (NAD+)
MIIKPSIRSNFFTNAHPLGCEQHVLEQIKEATDKPTFNGPKNVLIIGGSSGYGLASRIALAFGSNANTINVSFESGPRGKRSGTAGYWNNLYFQKHAIDTNNIHIDFLGDAFAKETKDLLIKTIKDTVGSVDLIIYSLAAGGRRDPETGEIVSSHIKTIGDPITGKTIDVKQKTVTDITVDNATQQDIEDTVFVMGGSDWSDWITTLVEANVLSKNVKTIAYTYIGGSTTQNIYRHGTLGKAKEDLENKAKNLNKLLKEKYQGEALISSSKAVVSKASVFIPQMPVYVSCLFDVMIKEDIHESILSHKYRLFKDMVYGDNRILDDQGRIRLDHLELDHTIQHKTDLLMHTIDNDTLMDLEGTKAFLQTFYQINGFNYDHIDYRQDIDLDALDNVLSTNFVQIK